MCKLVQKLRKKIYFRNLVGYKSHKRPCHHCIDFPIMANKLNERHNLEFRTDLYCYYDQPFVEDDAVSYLTLPRDHRRTRLNHKEQKAFKAQQKCLKVILIIQKFRQVKIC